MKKVVVTVAIIIIVSTFFNVFAVNTAGYIELPFYLGSMGTDPENHGLYLGTNSVNNNPIYAYYRVSEEKVVYAFTVQGVLYFCSEYSDAGGSIGTTNGRSQGYGVTQSDYYTETGLYYSKAPNNYGGEGIDSTILTDYNTIEDALLGNGGNQEDSYELHLTLQPGNVAYIRTDSSIATQYTLRCTMPSKNALFSSGQQWNSTQRYGWTSDLPSVNTSLTSFGSQIPWIVDSNKTNILGQTNQAVAGTVILGETNNYFVIVNPLYYAVQYGNNWGFGEAEANAINNGAIDIVFKDAYDVVVYPLTQNVSVDNNEASYTNTVSGQPYSGEVDPSTGDIIWTDPDGGTTPPQIGGGNIVASDTSSFKAWLQTLLTSITNIFQPAHDAITTLASAVSNFASWLYALYIWLPSPVLSVLTSAITLAIIIGVVKVFI